MLYVRSMNIRLLAHKSLKSSVLALLGVLVLGASSAAATNEIEGVWSFNGGSVAIQALPNGTFQGTVVTGTKFAECTHAVGEVMWTKITPQPDGSFWGFHQWFHAECKLDPQFVGPTAWRVLQNSAGERYLKVCFSHPGDSQPMIAASGACTGGTFGAVESALIAALPTAHLSAPTYVTLPRSQKCLSHRAFKIHLHDPKNDPLKKVVVTFRGHRTVITRQGSTFIGTIKLKGLPRGSFKIRISATTVLGHHFTSTRTYHTCISKLEPKKAKKAKKKHSKP
jgi:hypothetical protein